MVQNAISEEKETHQGESLRCQARTKRNVIVNEEVAVQDRLGFEGECYHTNKTELRVCILAFCMSAMH